MPSEVEGPPGSVVAIDGPAGAGKTTSGVWLAWRLGVPLIESGYLFRGVAAAPDGLDSLSRIDIDVRVPPDDEWRPSLRVGKHLVGEVRTPVIEERLSVLAKDPQVRSAVALRVAELSEKGGVVLGRRAATESCPSAPVRVLITADDEVRLRRRLHADAHQVADRRYGARLGAREPALLEGDELIYTMKLDTTEMSIGEVHEALWGHVQERLAP